MLSVDVTVAYALWVNFYPMQAAALVLPITVRSPSPRRVFRISLSSLTPF